MINQDLINQALVEIKKRPENYAYFFNNLTTADWLEPLKEKGFFTEPIAAVREKGAIAFPAWPESRYLVKIASQKPEEVYKIFLNLPDTDNIRIHEDIVDAAIQLPEALAKKLALKEASWLRSVEYMYYFTCEKYFRLSEKFFKSNMNAVALKLLDALLRFRVDTSERASLRDNPLSILEQHNFEEIVENLVPPLAKEFFDDIFTLIINRLENALEIGTSDKDYSRDYSHIWRPNLDQFENNYSHPVQNSLITGLLKVLEFTPIERRNAIVLSIEERGYNTFKRIGLRLRTIWDTVDQTETRRLLGTALYFDSTQLDRETYLYYKSKFPHLDSSVKEAFLNRIKVCWGCDRYFPISADERLQFEKKEAPARHWQYQKLHAISEYLEGSVRDYFLRLKSEFGEIDPLEHPYKAKNVSEGDERQDSIDFSSLTIAQLLDVASKWDDRPKNRYSHYATIEKLIAAVAEKPGFYIQSSTQLIGLSSIFTKSILRGLNNAINAGKSFGIEKGIDYFSWIAQAPEASYKQETDYSEYEATRSELADVLYEIFTKRNFPFEFRAKIWPVLNLLCSSPYPKNIKADSLRDVFNMTLNTAKSKALHSAVWYAIWVRENCEKLNLPYEGFSSMPEVKIVFETELNLEHNASEITSAVFGHYFNNLLYLDESWAKTNVMKIFPLDRSHNHNWGAAWPAYVCWHKPFKPSYDILHKQYLYALSQLKADEDETRTHESPSIRLGYHILLFYVWQNFELSTANNMFDVYFSKANETQRSRVLAMPGIMTRDSEVTPKIVTRFMELWEHRAKMALDQKSQELTCFGRWFSTGKFDIEWSLKQLSDVLRVVKKIEDLDDVCEHLESVSTNYPVLALDCLRKIVEVENRHWEIMLAHESIMKMLRKLLVTDDSNVTIRAKNIVNLMVAYGYPKYRELLMDPPESPPK